MTLFALCFRCLFGSLARWPCPEGPPSERDAETDVELRIGPVDERPGQPEAGEEREVVDHDNLGRDLAAGGGHRAPTGVEEALRGPGIPGVAAFGEERARHATQI